MVLSLLPNHFQGKMNVSAVAPSCSINPLVITDPHLRSRSPAHELVGGTKLE